ncbi:MULTISPECIES: ABC transporter substrate-binding protein [unclassified Mesorhizobium]|uniref:ABC transporter substrate-binding protein n=1 Tax=unclassified Mesorhizobium TaxID=325217 RepID=UPI001CCA2C76|nr:MULTISPECIES: ABC transporter substrate-binding protein [unclassified Mesorhizobium]MBZ9815243.1 ABC transporter substrate-binding protein [Mesorhizobium sp. CA7]MBZ9845108.1 ABC transporter substrate-binding protein [Mesorhizobium sp. CA5]MBZ9862084.1 ABC transporter substrate-binding protein [Mesorhizobium sp. CA12]
MKRVLQVVASFAALLPALAWAEPQKGGVIDVATVGEPPTLDPMASTADLVGIITQHIYETLYTFDNKWGITPLLAADMPTISPDGLTYTIPLRTGVKFHDGSDMRSADVMASLKRWMKVATRGKQAADVISSLDALDEKTVKITLKKPYAPLLSLLSLNNAAAIIIPSENADEDPLTKFIGTGPYMLKDRKPDQFIQLARFDGYRSRDGEPDGYGGARKQYLDEIRFVPVPDPNTRVEGAVAGQFAYADSLPVESYDKISGGKTKPLILKPFGWPVFVMNTKQGLNSDIRIRKAIQAALAPEDMLLAAFGSKDFYAVDGAMYPEGFAWHSNTGTEAYKPQGDTEKAAALLKDAGYDGKPLRILTSRQYEFHYKMAQVAQAYLEQAGFKVELDVVEWATLTKNRTDPALWDIYITHSPFLAEPSLNGFMSDNTPGWWSSDAKHKVLDAFNSETDPAKRAKLYEDVQKVIYDEAAVYKVGDFNALAAEAPNLKGVTPAPWPYFWNAYLEGK